MCLLNPSQPVCLREALHFQVQGCNPMPQASQIHAHIPLEALRQVLHPLWQLPHAARRRFRPSTIHLCRFCLLCREPNRSRSVCRHHPAWTWLRRIFFRLCHPSLAFSMGQMVTLQLCILCLHILRILSMRDTNCLPSCTSQGTQDSWCVPVNISVRNIPS